MPVPRITQLRMSSYFPLRGIYIGFACFPILIDLNKNMFNLNFPWHCLVECKHAAILNFRLRWLIDYLRFYVLLKKFSLIWRRHHYRWRAAKFRPMLGAQGLWAGGIVIVPHLLWHGASVFLVSSEEPPHSVASYYTQGDMEDLF
jgi:hypothetical protein